MAVVKADVDPEGYTVVSNTDADFKELCAQGHARAVWLAENDSGYVRKWAHKSGNPKQLYNPHSEEPAIRQVICAPAIRELLRAVFGEGLVYVTHSKLSYKCQGVKQAWLPHQDTGYARFKDVGQRLQVCVFLEDCDDSNGTLEIYPGSHRLGVLAHQIVFVEGELDPQVRVKDMPNLPSRSIHARQGDVLLFDSRTIHRSGANLKGGYRCLLIFEVALVSGHAFEADGRPALGFDLARDEIRIGGDEDASTAAVLIRRLVHFVLERGLYPLAKRCLRYTNRFFNVPRTVVTERG